MGRSRTGTAPRDADEAGKGASTAGTPWPARSPLPNVPLNRIGGRVCGGRGPRASRGDERLEERPEGGGGEAVLAVVALARRRAPHDRVARIAVLVLHAGGQVHGDGRGVAVVGLDHPVPRRLVPVEQI